jgi:hypothetical protein
MRTHSGLLFEYCLAASQLSKSRDGAHKLPKKVLAPVLQSDSGRRTKVENTLRSHFAENWRRLRLAIEEVVRPEVEQDRIPFLIFSRFGQNLAKPRSAQDQILDANERIDA